MDYLYLIHTKSLCDANNIWLENYYKRSCCPECRFIYPAKRVVDVDVVLEYAPDRAAVNSVEPPGIGIARKDFLALFENEVRDYLITGKVYVENDMAHPLENYVTFVGKHRVPVRGEKILVNNPCKSCGRLRYMGEYPWHVLRRSLDGRPIYDAAVEEGIIVTEDLRKRIDLKKWKGIDITKLPVIDEPLDGLDFPDHVVY